MAKKSLIEKEKKKKTQRRNTMLFVSLRNDNSRIVYGSKINFLSQKNYNLYHEIVHLLVFVTGAPQPDDPDLITEILVFPDTYSVKWHILVFFPE
uniref:Ribosomal protein S14 n=2 Tax=Ceratopteris TaxID=29595 RepID=A0A3G5CPB0_9MONI|nr:ribosomal protein S14 [Pteris vittata]AYW14688.1 ribosomal protein S14 [Ceratopteris cornuta]